MELGDILTLSYQDLACYTDNFCESNYLCHFQFGKLYRGKIGEQHVMVKIWEVSERYIYRRGDNESRLMDEIILFRYKKVVNRPGMVKLYGYCSEGGHLGVVYDFKPFESVFNLIPKDGFTWLQRIKVLLGFASLLSFLHTGKSPPYKPFIIRNLDCAHIVLDEDYNPKLCDFGLISGGIFPDRTIYKCHHVHGSYGYIDLSSFGRGSVKQDVFAFGVILASLISKRVFTEEDRLSYAPDVCEWAWKEADKYNDDSNTDSKKPKFSLVHQSLTEDPDFDPADEHKISAFALECTDDDLCSRPTMQQVLRSLLKLKVVKKHARFLGLKNVLCPYENVVFAQTQSCEETCSFSWTNNVLRPCENVLRLHAENFCLLAVSGLSGV